MIRCIPGASFFRQSICRPIANTRAMNVHSNAILVSTKNSLHFVFAKCIQKVSDAEGSILEECLSAIRLYRANTVTLGRVRKFQQTNSTVCPFQRTTISYRLDTTRKYSYRYYSFDDMRRTCTVRAIINDNRRVITFVRRIVVRSMHQQLESRKGIKKACVLAVSRNHFHRRYSRRV